MKVTQNDVPLIMAYILAGMPSVDKLKEIAKEECTKEQYPKMIEILDHIEEIASEMDMGALKKAMEEDKKEAEEDQNPDEGCAEFDEEGDEEDVLYKVLANAYGEENIYDYDMPFFRVLECMYYEDCPANVFFKKSDMLDAKSFKDVPAICRVCEKDGSTKICSFNLRTKHADTDNVLECVDEEELFSNDWVALALTQE